MTVSRQRRPVARIAVALALATVMGLTQAVQPCESADLGCSIFSGQHAIRAQLREEDRLLPDSTTRCVNCHTRTDSAGTFAPPLTPGNLLAAKSRRGGPASSYDQAAFCKALRDGIDPADIILRKAMPHYQIDDAECAALWRLVTRH